MNETEEILQKTVLNNFQLPVHQTVDVFLVCVRNYKSNRKSLYIVTIYTRLQMKKYFRHLLEKYTAEIHLNFGVELTKNTSSYNKM